MRSYRSQRAACAASRKNVPRTKNQPRQTPQCTAVTRPRENKAVPPGRDNCHRTTREHPRSQFARTKSGLPGARPGRRFPECLRPSPPRPRAPTRGRRRAERSGGRLVTAGGFGVQDEVEAQAVVVQASHQVVMIGVGDHCDPDVAANARTASGRSGKITALARRSAYASANCPAADSRRTARAGGGPPPATTSGTAQSQDRHLPPARW